MKSIYLECLCSLPSPSEGGELSQRALQNLDFFLIKLQYKNDTKYGNILRNSTWNFFLPEMEFLRNSHRDASPFTSLQLGALKRRSSSMPSGEGQKALLCSPLLQPGPCRSGAFVVPSVASPPAARSQCCCLASSFAGFSTDYCQLVSQSFLGCYVKRKATQR